MQTHRYFTSRLEPSVSVTITEPQMSESRVIGCARVVVTLDGPEALPHHRFLRVDKALGRAATHCQHWSGGASGSHCEERYSSVGRPSLITYCARISSSLPSRQIPAPGVLIIGLYSSNSSITALGQHLRDLQVEHWSVSLISLGSSYVTGLKPPLAANARCCHRLCHMHQCVQLRSTMVWHCYHRRRHILPHEVIRSFNW